jgi:hypothetical protein
MRTAAAREWAQMALSKLESPIEAFVLQQLSTFDERVTDPFKMMEFDHPRPIPAHERMLRRRLDGP